jgi:hypothetical protein
VSVEWFPTANSHTKVAYDTGWLVLDIGSGHNPHPRADVLVDSFLSDDAERSGRAAVLPAGKHFVVADACAMPFRDKTFDFSICSHVAEHVEDVDGFCSELNRVARGGYLETPSKLAEVLRHAPNHRWYVSINRRGALFFSPTPDGYPLGWFGKLFWSVYFYRTINVQGRDVFQFAFGCRKPWHYGIILVRRLLVKFWLSFKSLTYTRLLWKDSFSWQVEQSSRS